MLLRRRILPHTIPSSLFFPSSLVVATTQQTSSTFLVRSSSSTLYTPSRKFSSAETASMSSGLSEAELAELKKQVEAQGAVVKQLKSAGKGNADEDVKREVAKLLELKNKLPKEEKKPAPAAGAAAAASSSAEGAAADQQQQKQPKVDKKAERAAARLAEEQARAKAKAEADAATASKYAHLYGHKEICSESSNTTPFVEIKDLNKDTMNGATVTMRARVHTCRKQGGKMAFLVLRNMYDSIQALVLSGETVPAEMVAFAAALHPESIVDVTGKVHVVEKPITSTSQQNLELHVEKLHVVSESQAVLPFQYEDAKRSVNNNTQNLPTINVDTRLLCRWMDMRTPASNAIFRLQSRVGQYFRQFLLDNDFIEIHSPKIIGTASEGGAHVFKLDYMGRPGYLAQSPQLYKQMALQGDLERVFEVAPVFRAEDSNTHRHLTEFMGLDMEMRIHEHYFEVLDMGEALFNFMFTHLVKHTRELDAVNEQYPFDPFVWKMTPEKIKELGVGDLDGKVETTDQYHGRVRSQDLRMLRMPFPSAIALLNTQLPDGTKLQPTDDINTENEKLLGRLVKARYGVDFYIVDRFPLCLRPFYTMPCPDDKRFSNSYDIFMRGEEISSGAQRVHMPALLEERAKEKGVKPESIKDYIDSFRLGAWPHGGFGVGLERVVMLYLGLKNIRYCTLFPRDPQRLHP